VGECSSKLVDEIFVFFSNLLDNFLNSGVKMYLGCDVSFVLM